MSKNEECSPHGWTVDTLEVYLSSKIESIDKIISTRLDGVEKAVITALNSADRAVNKSEEATEKRFESVNEFRSALSDQTRSFIPRSEYSVQHKSVVDAIEAIGARVSTIETVGVTKQQGISTLGAFVVGVFIIVSTVINIGTLLVTFFVRH